MSVRASLHIAECAPGIRSLTLHNPDRRNALDPHLVEALAQALDPASLVGVRALLIRGAPGAFCAGYDLSALPASTPDVLPDDRLGEVMALLADHAVPSVALVEGAAFGAGCELACACDFRVGTPQALFCMPPAKLGIVYAPAGIARVARIVGWQRARRMFLTAARVDATVATQWGLLDSCVGVEDAEKAALTLCTELAQGAPLAVSGMKRIVSTLARPGLDDTDAQAFRALRHQAFSSDDAAEGRAAFLQKRTPSFRGG